MKKVICIAVISFSFLGVSSSSKPTTPSEQPKKPIVETPQIDYEVKIWQNKLKVQNSELKVGIAEFIFKQ